MALLGFSYHLMPWWSCTRLGPLKDALPSELQSRGILDFSEHGLHNLADFNVLTYWNNLWFNCKKLRLLFCSMVDLSWALKNRSKGLEPAVFPAVSESGFFFIIAWFEKRSCHVSTKICKLQLTRVTVAFKYLIGRVTVGRLRRFNTRPSLGSVFVTWFLRN